MYLYSFSFYRREREREREREKQNQRIMENQRKVTKYHQNIMSHHQNIMVGVYYLTFRLEILLSSLYVIDIGASLQTLFQISVVIASRDLYREMKYIITS